MAKKNENKQIEKSNIEEKQQEKKSNKRLSSIGKAVLIVLIVCGGGFLAWQNIILSKRLTSLEQGVSTLENSLSENADNSRKMVDNNRKIYVFNMDEAVKNIGLKEANQKFEEDINNLDAQVKEAQSAIKGIKDEKMKKKMLNLSIKPLEMKRDDLLKSYSQSMQETLGKINTALAELATEQNISVIFMNRAVAVNTNYVVDVTPQVVEKVKGKQ